MEVKLAFASSGAPFLERNLRSPATRGWSQVSMTSAPAVSRRKLGQLALGASASVIAATIAGPVVAAATQKPAFIKDESGIRYYDVKAGTGSGPIDGDFVIIDYVSSHSMLSTLSPRH